MKTNDLKKGTMVMESNGWKAKLLDNMKGNTRLAEVYGDYTECGSIYAHDIVGYFDSNGFYKTDIEYTDSQLKCKN